MNRQELSTEALDILMKEYEHLKDEIKERLKVAFSHVAYAGAIAAFAIPAAEKVAGWIPYLLLLVIAGAGLFGLGWVAFLNMRWVQHCGQYLRKIEEKINAHFGTEVLGWEGYSSELQASMRFYLPPRT